MKSTRYFKFYFVLRKCRRLPAKLQQAAGDVYQDTPVSCKSVENVYVLVVRVNDKLLFGLRALLGLSVGRKFGKCGAIALQFYVPLCKDREGKINFL